MKNISLLAALQGLAVVSPALDQTNVPAGGIAISDGQKVAFLGDSITSFGFINPAGYISLVVSGPNTCGLNVTPIPTGGSGNNSKNLLACVGKDVIGRKPDWVTISRGINDASYPQDACALEPFKANMTVMVEQCQNAGIQVMLLNSTVFGESARRNHSVSEMFNYTLDNTLSDLIRGASQSH